MSSELEYNFVVNTYAFAKLHPTREILSQCTVFFHVQQVSTENVMVSALFGHVQCLESFLNSDGHKYVDVRADSVSAACKHVA